MSVGVIAALIAPFASWFEGDGVNQAGWGGWGNEYFTVALLIGFTLTAVVTNRKRLRGLGINEWAMYVVGGVALIVFAVARAKQVANFGGYSDFGPDWGLWLAFGSGAWLILVGLAIGVIRSRQGDPTSSASAI